MKAGTNPSFSLDDRHGWAGFLAEHGYAVVRGALAPTATAAAMDELGGLFYKRVLALQPEPSLSPRQRALLRGMPAEAAA